MKPLLKRMHVADPSRLTVGNSFVATENSAKNTIILAVERNLLILPNMAAAMIVNTTSGWNFNVIKNESLSMMTSLLVG